MDEEVHFKITNSHEHCAVNVIIKILTGKTSLALL